MGGGWWLVCVRGWGGVAGGGGGGGGGGRLTLPLDVLVDLRLKEGHLFLAAPLIVQQGLCTGRGEVKLGGGVG